MDTYTRWLTPPGVCALFLLGALEDTLTAELTADLFSHLIEGFQFHLVILEDGVHELQALDKDIGDGVIQLFHGIAELFRFFQ